MRSLRDSLRSAETQTAVVLKKDYYEQCAGHLADLEEIHPRETFKGREAYFDAFTHWKKIFVNQLREVYKEVDKAESVTSNPYSKGYPLSPETPGNAPLFLDRTDIKEELALKIQTSVSMPTFLVLGQRRVGKTSLLNFLPELLDPSGFLVASIDAQSMSGEMSVAGKLKIKDEWNPPEDWLEAWDEFTLFLNTLTAGNRRRLILAMDEYDEEQGFQRALQQNPERAAAFLSRMRAFSQSQKRIVFMFIGATQFSDLPEPKWSKYFVHVHIMRIGYLSKSASLQLIENPVPEFRLRYGPGLAEHIYELTQGHPHLLHSICSDLVDYANQERKNPVDIDDLDKIIREKTIQRGEQPFSVFWDEFCEKPEMKQAVLAIAREQPVDASSPEVRRLLDYQYVVRDERGQYQLRVPLFREWLLLYGY
jgi:hypothetical protein